MRKKRDRLEGPISGMLPCPKAVRFPGAEGKFRAEACPDVIRGDAGSIGTRALAVLERGIEQVPAGEQVLQHGFQLGGIELA